MNYGAVELGARWERTLRITNQGTDTLTVTGFSVSPVPQGQITATIWKTNWLGGVIQPGSGQDVIVSFFPQSVANYSAILTVQANYTGGVPTIGLNASGVRTGPIWSRSGSGDTVFDMPTFIQRVKVIGTYPGRSSNFIATVGGRLLVNELLGTAWGSTRYEGTLLTGGGGAVAITNSSGVAWSVEEVR